MAEVFSVTQASISTGTALKTLMELATASTARATLISWWVEFDGVSSTAVPIKVELARATAAITGTAVTEVKYKDWAPTPLAQALHTATAEGTVGDILEKHFVHPQSGLLIQYPLGREPEVPVSGFIRVQVTAAASVNACVGMVWEE
jgi:hypothetical protein